LIIQDRFRAGSFFINNEIYNVPIIQLPVSIPSYVKSENGTKGKYWHEMFSLSSEVKIILYFGLLKKDTRGIEKFIDEFSDKEGIAIIFHGYGGKKLVKMFKKLSAGKQIYISSHFVPEEEVDLLITSSDIGLSWYSNSDDNNRHTAFSSEKIALFLKNGIPVFTNFSETYNDLYSKFECGIGSQFPKSLGDSSSMIINNYEKYSSNAFCAFDFFYSYEKNIAVAEQSISDILLTLEKKN